MNKHKISYLLGFFIGIVVVLYSFLFEVKIKSLATLTKLPSIFLFKIFIFTVGVLIILFSLSYFFNFNRLKKLSKNAFKLIAIVILISIAIEVILQIADQTPKLTEPDEILHHKFISNLKFHSKTNEWDVFYNINSFGLRGEEVELTKNKILVLGDSFTFGIGVNLNQTFPELLKKKINGHGKNIEVVNAGVISYSPVLEYLFLKQKISTFKPSLVILNFDMSDLQDDYNYFSSAKKDNNNLVIAAGEETDLSRSVFSSLKTLQIINSLISKASKSETTNYIKPGDILTDRFAFTRNGIEITKEYQNALNISLTYLLEINKLSKKHNSGFIITVYPYGHQVNTKEWNLGRGVHLFKNDTFYSDRLAKIIENFGKENNITVFNLFQGFKDSTDYPLYYPYDGHLTEKGHGLMADLMYNNLIKGGQIL